MSDYLWDKSGEADAEVERLEMLLGTLRHVPRPLELPAAAATPEPPTPGRFRLPRIFGASRTFTPYGLAAAAAFLLALLLGASALLRARLPAGGARDAALETGPSRESPAGEKASGPTRAPAPEAASRRGGNAAAAGREKGLGGVAGVGAKGALEELARGARRPKGGRLAVAAARRQKQAPPAAVGSRAEGGFAFEAMRAGGEVGALLVEDTRLLAKEQLVYALRLTGAQLREVRQRTRGSDGSRRPAGGFGPIR